MFLWWMMGLSLGFVVNIFGEKKLFWLAFFNGRKIMRRKTGSEKKDFFEKTILESILRYRASGWGKPPLSQIEL